MIGSVFQPALKPSDTIGSRRNFERGIFDFKVLQARIKCYLQSAECYLLSHFMRFRAPALSPLALGSSASPRRKMRRMAWKPISALKRSTPFPMHLHWSACTTYGPEISPYFRWRAG